MKNRAPLDSQQRHNLLQDTMLATPMSAMRTAFGLISSYWRSPEKYKAMTLAGMIGGLTVPEVFLNVRMAHGWKNIFDTMIAKDFSAMGTHSLLQGGMMLGVALIVGTRHYLGQDLHMSWRNWLSDKFSNAYLDNKSFYHTNNAPGTTDNPDLCMTDNIKQLTGSLIGLGMGGIHAAASLISFTGMMLGMTDPAQVAVFNHTLNVPGPAFWLGFGSALGCAAAGTWLIHKIGTPLIFLSQKQLSYDANYRSSLFDIRSHATEIAFHEKQDIEKQRLTRLFNDIRENWYERMRVEARLMTSMTFYNDSSKLLSMGISGAAYGLSKTMTGGGVLQFSTTFDQLRGNMSWFINVYPALVDVKALLKRLTSFAGDIAESQNPAVLYEKNYKGDIKIKSAWELRDSFLVKNLVMKSAQGKTMLTLPEFEVRPGERVNITGDSGCGKTTFFAAARGLHPFGSGEFVQPQGKKIFFASQTPYILNDSTLKDNICYDYTARNFSDKDVEKALSLAELDELVPYMHETTRHGSPWRTLSLGEKQRIVFARIFLHRPDFVWLDEGTSALNARLQDKMYTNLDEHLPGTAIVNIAHRQSAARHHNRHIVVENGTFHEAGPPAPEMKPGLLPRNPPPALPGPVLPGPA